MADEKKINVDDIVEDIKDLNNTHDHTADYDTQDINDNKLMAVLAYIGFLVLIPLFLAKSKFAKFHTNQGLLLLIVEVIWGIISSILNIIPLIGWIISLIGSGILLIVAIIGIINVVNGRAKELPVIGKIRLLK